MCALLSYEKKDLSTGKYEEVIPPFDIRSNTLPIRVDDLELGTYRYKLKYSSVNTRNYKNVDDADTDSNTIYTSGDIVLKAPYADTITAQVAKVPFNDTLTSITFSWTLHHKKATNLKLYWCEYYIDETDGKKKKKKDGTVNLKNTSTYHNPSHYFANENEVQFYFTFDSEDVDWGTNTDHVVPSDYASNIKHNFTV